jgi:hypothetical protein
LNLINPDVDPSNPEDVAYVSSGYAPMTVRWIEAAMRGYAGLDDAMKELPAAAGVGVGSGGGGGGGGGPGGWTWSNNGHPKIWSRR